MRPDFNTFLLLVLLCEELVQISYGRQFLMPGSLLSSVCQLGWIYLNSPRGDICYKIYSKTSLTAEEARHECQGQRSTLLTIKNVKEREFLNSALQLHGAGKSYWLGLSDKKTENSWMWDNGASFTDDVIHWYPGKPDGNSHENCAVLVDYGARGRYDKIDDYACYHPTAVHNFVCHRVRVDTIEPASPEQTTSEPAAVPNYELDLHWEYSMTWHVPEHRTLKVLDYNPHKWDPTDPKAPWSVLSAPYDDLGYARIKYERPPPDFDPDKVLVLDGKHRKKITTRPYGSTLITVNEGSNVMIKINNKLMTESATVHWHGLHQRHTWFMDGVAMLQQCLIPPGSSFTVNFTAEPAGTYFYHGHYKTISSHGLHGPLIIHKNEKSAVISMDPLVKVTPEADYIVELDNVLAVDPDDAARQATLGIDAFSNDFNPANLFTHHKSYDGTWLTGHLPMSTLLINDRGWNNQTEMRNSPHRLPLAKFNVDPSKYYKFRLIHEGAIPYMFSITGHEFTVIATDGMDTKPIVATQIILYPAERYDIILKTKDIHDARTTGPFYLKVEVLERFEAGTPASRFDHPLMVYAFLTYSNITTNTSLNARPPQEPNFTNVINCPWNISQEFMKKAKVSQESANSLCTRIDQMHSLDSQAKNPALRQFPDNFIHLNMGFDSFNGLKFVYPSRPVYGENLAEVTVPCKRKFCHPKNISKDPDCHCFHHFQLAKNAVVELVVTSLGTNKNGVANGATHPLHIHGMQFYVVYARFGTYGQKNGRFYGEDNSTFPVDCSLSGCSESVMRGFSQKMRHLYNLEDPPLKDTVIVPAGGYVVLRFFADNPGWWPAHCHVEHHHLSGMAFALKVGSDKEIAKPPPHFPKCGPMSAV